MPNQSIVKIGISIGDLNGIGPEVVLRSLSEIEVFGFVPIIYGNITLLEKLQEAFGTKLNMASSTGQINYTAGTVYVNEVWNEEVQMTYGTIDTNIGKYAFRSLEAATSALKQNDIDILITAPIHKASIKSDQFQFAGHTDYLNQQLTGSSLMMLVSDVIRVGLLTDHVPLDQVSSLISKELVMEKVRAMHESLIKDFGIARPKIALLGVDPHAGDSGAIGEIDGKILSPTVITLREIGIEVKGPFAADGFFGSRQHHQFDGILASYHDQGLVPFKLLSFGKGVNFTAGLDKIRVSPDHGTAFTIAGQGVASTSSFEAAIRLGIDIYQRRKHSQN